MAAVLHRLQFGFTISYHYLFPQLTMGLALLIVVFKTISIVRNSPLAGGSARFWGRIFSINFVFGVVTGIPMEFQFGTNWSAFSQRTGGLIGQPLAMEGVFSFFLESAFLGLFLFGERRLSKWGHWGAAFMVFLGSWLSGYFIIVANAWMQHPVAYRVLGNGTYDVTSFSALLNNPWALLEYGHTMSGAVITAAFVIAATGAFYLLSNRFPDYGQMFLRTGVISGLLFSMLQIFPTGDALGRYTAYHQATAMDGMEGHFHTGKGAPLVILGQPNVEEERIDNPLVVNRMLSFLIYGTPNAEVAGLDAFPRENWPTNIPLLYYAYHIMAGLGTAFLALMAASAFLLWRNKLFTTRWILWALMLSFPFPYIANTAGWFTAEMGRQPWLVYGLLRTNDGYSKAILEGNTMFTLLGFLGLYTLLSVLFVLLMYRELDQGPGAVSGPEVDRSGVPVPAREA
ncbi:MAG TPA: cytochrome ubiquinol oxidase subunit I [Bryobacteraceae bacterium]|nr:cytochrome ubiquinol oxidase subunit I [Bryobacteraceae bacterium]